MKRTLVKLNKKDFMVEIGGKQIVALAGSYYCSKCGYKMLPDVHAEGKGTFQRAEFMVDVSCLCDQK